MGLKLDVRALFTSQWTVASNIGRQYGGKSAPDAVLPGRSHGAVSRLLMHPIAAGLDASSPARMVNYRPSAAMMLTVACLWAHTGAHR